jgi:SAM-dependent methyltransferase
MLDTIPETRQFSLISALHVLEHVDGQVDLLRKFRGCLHEDGILLIAVPSFHELPKHTRKHYCINYPNHIVALTDRAIETILAMAGFDLLSGTANAWANSYLVAARRSATAAAKISRKPLSAAIAALKDSKTGDIRSGWLWRRLPIRYRAARMNAFYTGKIKRRRERKARRQQEAAEIVPRA